MISQQTPFFNSLAIAKTSPFQEFTSQYSPLAAIGREGSKIVFSNYLTRPGSVESARSSGTDLSENPGFVPTLQLTPIYTKPYIPCSSSSQPELNKDLVCGDRASGVHYSVTSCNGCKTFFRRTVVTGRKFVCKHNKNCLLEKDVRCRCRACRWSRCIEVGMDAQAIQYAPTANLTLSIVRKRFQRSLQIPGLQSEHERILLCIDQVLHLDEQFKRLRCSSFFNYDSNIRLDDLLQRSSSLADANKYPLVDEWPSRPQNLNFIDDLGKLEKVGIKFWFYLDLYLSVEYIKTLPVFHQLTTMDKYLLIFDTAIKDTYISSSYYAYTKQVDEVIVYPDNSRPFMQRESLLELEKLIRRGVVPEMCDLKPDQVQFSLMRAICALNYTSDELSEEGQELISKECSKYTTALLRYLQNKYDLDLGTKKFGDSMRILEIICKRVENNYSYFEFKRCVLHIPPPSILFNEVMTKRISTQKRSITEN